LPKFKLYPIKGITRRRKPSYNVAEAPKAPAEEPDESRQRQIYRQIGAHPGDELVAKRVETLEKRLPGGTIPELVAYDWLKGQNEEFQYQVEVDGGRRTRGGRIPDFIVEVAGRQGLAWLIQGGYYHSAAFQQKHGQEGRDILAEMELMGKVINGVRIVAVVQLQEYEIYHRRPGVFKRALQGA
jgi:hypothetical protein